MVFQKMTYNTQVLKVKIQRQKFIEELIVQVEGYAKGFDLFSEAVEEAYYSIPYEEDCTPCQFGEKVVSVEILEQI